MDFCAYFITIVLILSLYVFVQVDYRPQKQTGFLGFRVFKTTYIKINWSVIILKATNQVGGFQYYKIVIMFSIFRFN